MNILYAMFSFIFGLIFGSFYNVIIYRVPKGISISRGTSMCPSCQHQIMPHELIPIISYIFLKGRCSHCHSKISIRYPIIELITGILFLISFLVFGFSLQTIVSMVVASLCVIITMIDIDTMEILDRFHFIFIMLAIIHISLVSSLPLTDHIIGAFIISVPLYLLALSTGGIGGGDIKLMASAGLLLGYQASIVAFFLAAVTGGCVAILFIISKLKDRKSLMAFGPYLCIGIFIAYLFGLNIFKWYLSLFI